jgi:methylase of polypeptide subunit release factors
LDDPPFCLHRILELGSGSGIVGMALALATISFAPSCLILTDGEDTSVELMQQNISQVNNQQLISTNSHCIYTTTMEMGRS